MEKNSVAPRSSAEAENWCEMDRAFASRRFGICPAVAERMCRRSNMVAGACHHWKCGAYARKAANALLLMMSCGRRSGVEEFRRMARTSWYHHWWLRAGAPWRPASASRVFGWWSGRVSACVVPS